jgi:catechol 2,3-dioxygenase-like lactoylglutathione lyase family enzyme
MSYRAYHDYDDDRDVITCVTLRTRFGQPGDFATAGRIDHFGPQAASPGAFDIIRTRLMDEGASDGTITDFGSAHSVFFRDPDGLEGEVLLNKG